MTDAPRWAQDLRTEQDAGKGARLAALHLLGARLAHVPKTHIAEALGVSRWTLDRDLAALPDVERYVKQMMGVLEIEIQEHDRTRRQPPRRA